MQTETHKQRAADLGLEWPVVLEAYRAARELEREELDRQAATRRDAIRGQAGHEHAGRWKLANRAAFNGGDATYIRGLDVTAAGRGMSADELFAELAGQADDMRPADQVMAETIDRLAGDASPAAEDEFLPLPAAAAVADITEQWLRKLVKAGRIRHRRTGRRWLVSAADVQFFSRHPTAGRPRLRAGLEPAPF